MCSYSRAWTYTLNRQATYEWTYSLLSISNAMDYPTHYFMSSIDSFYDERLCQSPTRICSRNVTMDTNVWCIQLCLLYWATTFLRSHPWLYYDLWKSYWPTHLVQLLLACQPYTIASIWLLTHLLLFHIRNLFVKPKAYVLLLSAMHTSYLGWLNRTPHPTVGLSVVIFGHEK